MDKQQNRVVVLGNDHTNSLGIAQSMGRAGFEVLPFVWGVKSGMLRHSRYVKQLYSAKDAQACVDLMIKVFSNEKGKTPIIACCDLAALTLEANKERLEQNFLFEYATNYTLEYLAVKEHQVNLALEVGFNVPRTWVLDSIEELPQDVCFPCLIKPLVSSKGAKSDIKVCRTMEELHTNYRSLRYTEKVILQQYIEHDYEISILGCGKKNGEVQIPCVENKLSLYPKNVGLECLANMQPLDDDEINRSIQTLIKRIGYVGLFSVEMMHNKADGKFYFTEINLRNDGANSFVLKYGVNLPLIHVADLQDKAHPTFNTFQPGYYIWEMHHLSSLLHREIGLRQWVKEIRKSKDFLTYFREDKIPFFWQFVSPFLRKLHLTDRGTY